MTIDHRGGEIITLSLGSVGALASIHYWNSIAANAQRGVTGSGIAPSYDTSVLLERSNGSYCPRYVALDASQAIPVEVPIVRTFPLQEDGTFHTSADALQALDQCDDDSNTKPRDAPANPVSPTPTPTSKEQPETARSSRSWYEMIPFSMHPRSVLSPTFAEEAIDSYGYGRQLLDGAGSFSCPLGGTNDSTLSGTMRVADALEDSVRWHLEACDQVQGFQFLGEAESMFGGLAESTMIHLRDSIAQKLPMFYHGSLSAAPDAKSRATTCLQALAAQQQQQHDAQLGEGAMERAQRRHVVNRALSAVLLNTHADLFLPTNPERLLPLLPESGPSAWEEVMSSVLPCVMSATMETAWNRGGTKSLGNLPFYYLRDLLQHTSHTCTAFSYLSFPHPPSLPPLHAHATVRTSHATPGTEVPLWNEYFRIQTSLDRMDERDRQHEMLATHSNADSTPNSVTYAQLWSSRGVDTTEAEIRMHVSQNRFRYFTQRSCFLLDSQPVKLSPCTPSVLFHAKADPEHMTRIEEHLPNMSVNVAQYLQINSHYSHVLSRYRENVRALRRLDYAEYHMESDEWSEVQETMCVLMDEYDPENRFDSHATGKGSDSDDSL